MSRHQGVLADNRLDPAAKDLARALDMLIAGTDSGRIARGLAMAARTGYVDDLEFEADGIHTFVAGSRGGRYFVNVHYPTFDSYERTAWEFVTGAAGYGPEIAAGTCTRELLRFAEDSGCPVVPAPGEIDLDCDCPDPEPVCKHIIAVLKTFVDAADSSVSTLLRARGISISEPATAQAAPEGAGRTRWAATTFEDGPAPAEAFARIPGPLPQTPVRPETPSPPCFYDGPWDPGRFTAEITADRLDLQAAIAAKAAYVALDAADRGLGVSPRPDDLRFDALRVAALAREQAPELARLAGCPPREVEDRGLAWLYGGADGVAVVAEGWKPDVRQCREADERFARAIGATTRRENRWTLTGMGIQLRLGRDGRWYPFIKEGSRWRLAAPPRADLDGVVRWVETSVAGERTEPGHVRQVTQGSHLGR
jgi:uncharacterized Zn finger protein